MLGCFPGIKRVFIHFFARVNTFCAIVYNWSVRTTAFSAGEDDSENCTVKKVWRQPTESFRKEAIIDLDGTIAVTTGECKGGMYISYNGICGCAPLIVSLANTNEVLYETNEWYF